VLPVRGNILLITRMKQKRKISHWCIEKRDLHCGGRVYSLVVGVKNSGMKYKYLGLCQCPCHSIKLSTGQGLCKTEIKV
jgi:hypothetical protein